MKRIGFLAYGVACHVMFLGVFAYMAGFVGNLFVPKSIDSGAAEPLATALAVDIGLILLFAVQHSVMARPAFKRFWTRFVPRPIERSTYVLLSNLVVILLMWQWRPIGGVVWEAPAGIVRTAATALFVVGWLMVPTVSLMIHHFDLFGTRQVWLHYRGREYSPLPFRTPWAYRYVRHPLYVGWALAFWATPTMTVGHLLFAASMTFYMAVASVVEERDLIDHFGREYERYKNQVPKFVPRLTAAATAEAA